MQDQRSLWPCFRRTGRNNSVTRACKGRGSRRSKNVWSAVGRATLSLSLPDESVGEWSEPCLGYSQVGRRGSLSLGRDSPMRNMFRKRS